MSFFIVNIIGFFISLIFYIIIFNIKDVETLKMIALFINSLIIIGIFFNLFRDLKKDNYNKYLKNHIKELKNYIDNLRKKEDTFFLYYNETKKKNDNLIRIKHDIKNELQIAYAMVNENRKISMKLLDELDNKLENVEIINFCKNPILNTILNIKKIETEKEDIVLSFDIDKSFDLNMEEIDICDLFSNILDNSIEAVKCANEKEKTCENGKIDKAEIKENKINDNFIKLSIAKKNDYNIIKCENTYNGKIKTDKDNSNKIITTKVDKNKHGYGMDIIKEIVSKYNGEFNIETNNNVFEIIIIFKGVFC